MQKKRPTVSCDLLNKSECLAGVSCQKRFRPIGYMMLMKPGIVLLVIMTGFATVALEGTLFKEPLRCTGVLIGTILMAGAANTFNQIWDRDIDGIMKRTKLKRPIPTALVSVRGAILFCVLCGVLSVMLLLVAGNLLATALGIGGFAVYAIYTVFLKRTTPFNVVLGGFAGASVPLICWAAVQGRISGESIILFLIIFLWSPPHFWALSLYRKDDYARAGIPMLPVTAGEKKTRNQIACYNALLLPLSIYFGFWAGLGSVYRIGMVLLGIVYALLIVNLLLCKNDMTARMVFRFSIIYLTVLSGLVVVSRWVPVKM